LRTRRLVELPAPLAAADIAGREEGEVHVVVAVGVGHLQARIQQAIAEGPTVIGDLEVVDQVAAIGLDEASPQPARISSAEMDVDTLAAEGRIHADGVVSILA